MKQRTGEYHAFQDVKTGQVKCGWLPVTQMVTDYMATHSFSLFNCAPHPHQNGTNMLMQKSSCMQVMNITHDSLCSTIYVFSLYPSTCTVNPALYHTRYT